MFKNIQTVSPEQKAQISRLVDIWREHLKDALVGVYLHGSLAQESFVEGTSDVDVLIVTERKIPREERLSIAKSVIAIDKKPSPLEMSAICIDNLIPWSYPTFCQFHYSDTWTERYKQMLSGELKENFIVDTDFDDHDVASYVRLTNQCGICIYGRSITDVFPEVPEPDFWDSISREIDEYTFSADHPKHFDGSVLPLLGRILSYKRENRILSKYDAALWLKDYLVAEIKREG